MWDRCFCSICKNRLRLPGSMYCAGCDPHAFNREYEGSFIYGVDLGRPKDIVGYSAVTKDRVVVLRDGIPCGRWSDPPCLSHVTRRCAGCGRLQGRNDSLRSLRNYVPNILINLIRQIMTSKIRSVGKRIRALMIGGWGVGDELSYHRLLHDLGYRECPECGVNTLSTGGKGQEKGKDCP